MKKIAERFKNDPVFAAGVVAVGAVFATTVLKATAQIVEAAVSAKSPTNIYVIDPDLIP